jgi:hypothetical protein
MCRPAEADSVLPGAPLIEQPVQSIDITIAPGQQFGFTELPSLTTKGDVILLNTPGDPYDPSTWSAGVRFFDLPGRGFALEVTEPLLSKLVGPGDLRPDVVFLEKSTTTPYTVYEAGNGITYHIFAVPEPSGILLGAVGLCCAVWAGLRSGRKPR